MADESPLFGQLSQMNPSGRARDSKEVPVSKEFRRKPGGGKKPRKGPGPEESGREEQEEGQKEKAGSGKVVDILV